MALHPRALRQTMIQGVENAASKPRPERFAAAAVFGTSGPQSSGFTRIRVMDVRKKAKVASEYDSYQQNQCCNCRKNAGSSLAIQPPSETMRLYRA